MRRAFAHERLTMLAPRRVLLSGAVLALLGLSGCLHPARYDPFAPSVMVLIHNVSGTHAELYVHRRSGRHLLGRLEADQTRHYLIPWREEPINIRAEFPGLNYAHVSIESRWGQTFHFRLHHRRFVLVTGT